MAGCLNTQLELDFIVKPNFNHCGFSCHQERKYCANVERLITFTFCLDCQKIGHTVIAWNFSNVLRQVCLIPFSMFAIWVPFVDFTRYITGKKTAIIGLFFWRVIFLIIIYISYPLFNSWCNSFINHCYSIAAIQLIISNSDYINRIYLEYLMFKK